jgi:hypothetical protein
MVMHLSSEQPLLFSPCMKNMSVNWIHFIVNNY